MGDVYGGVTSAVGVIGKFEEMNGDGDGDGDGDGRWRWKRSAGRMARAWGLWAWRLARQKLLYLPYLKVPCTSTSYSTTSTYLPDLLGTVRVYYGSDSEEIC